MQNELSPYAQHIAVMLERANYIELQQLSLTIDSLLEKAVANKPSLLQSTSFQVPFTRTARININFRYRVGNFFKPMKGPNLSTNRGVSKIDTGDLPPHSMLFFVDVVKINKAFDCSTKDVSYFLVGTDDTITEQKLQHILDAKVETIQSLIGDPNILWIKEVPEPVKLKMTDVERGLKLNKGYYRRKYGQEVTYLKIDD